jgi:hypothetical protein
MIRMHEETRNTYKFLVWKVIMGKILLINLYVGERIIRGAAEKRATVVNSNTIFR